MNYYQINSQTKKIPLDVLIALPTTNPKAMVVVVHGMAEYKERYLPFINVLVAMGYGVVAYDHLGHGKSVLKPKELGYFYEGRADVLVQDMAQIIAMLQREYLNVPIYIFAHSMGTLVARLFLKQYSACVDKVVLSGPVTDNMMMGLASKLVDLFVKLQGGKTKNKWLNNLMTNRYRFKGESKDAWINSDVNQVVQYTQDPLCGFLMTNNGLQVITKMLLQVYDPNNWKQVNKNCQILLLAGEDDKVVGGFEKLNACQYFLQEQGFESCAVIEYPQARHEIMHDVCKDKVMNDIVAFFQK